MNYKSVSMFDLNPMDLTNVVHPMYQNLYLRRLKRIKYLEVHHVLVIEQLSKNDGLFDDFGEVRKDVPFSLRCHINNTLKRGNFHRGKLATMGGGRTRSVEMEPPRKELSEYEQIPPLSASVVEYEKTHGITKKTINVTSPTIEEMITNPELDGISSVNIDPVSMAVETVIDLIEGGKEFIANPSLGGVAAMAVTAIPGKYADKVLDELQVKKIFSAYEFKAPSGISQKVYQQDIDWDLNVNTRSGVKTNLELVQNGRSPFVIKDGKYSQINLHHSKQNSRGSLFELSAKTHQKYYGSNSLHPYLPSKHPINPVDRDVFNVDRDAYWIERGKNEVKKR